MPELPYPSDISGAFVTGTATANAQYFFADFLGAAGLIGDVIFIVCSSYFLLESRKMKIGKVVSMILNTFVISLIFMTVFLSLGYKLSTLKPSDRYFRPFFRITGLLPTI